MPGRQPDDWGIPLREAIERWTPEELSTRYRAIAEYDIPLFVLGGEEDPLHSEASTLHQRISEALIARLARGELIASGIPLPLKDTSRRRDIRPELWPLLAFSSGFRLVTGGRLKYDQVLIREARPPTGNHTQQKRDPAEQERSAHSEPSRAGRPSVMPMIEAEMRRRADAGLIERSLRCEAEVLAMWAQEQFAGSHVPKPKSIQKQLGAIYRELKATNRPDK